MSSRFFIIDDNASFRVKLTQMLKSEWPGSKVEQFEPAVQGWPEENIDWSVYDLLFLDHLLKGESGLKWYEVLKQKPHFPPTVILSPQPDPELAVRVIKAGAAHYLPKQQLTREKLREIVQEIFNRPNSATVVKNENTGSSVRITVAPSAAEDEIEKTQLMGTVTPQQVENAVEKTQIIGSVQMPPPEAENAVGADS